MLKRVSILLALIGIGVVTLLVLKLKKPEPAPQPLVEPSRAPYAESIGARGMVEAVDENVRIAPLLPGLIAEVYVKVGDRVKKGDPLFRQDTRDAEARIANQRAQAGLLEAKVHEAEVMLSDRQDSFQRADKLRVKDVTSEDDRQRKYYAMRSAETALATTRADLELAKAQLEQSLVNLDLLTVRSPRDAEILKVDLRAGEYASVPPTDLNNPSLLLGETRFLQLRADVDEDSASRVRTGAPAVAFIKGMKTDPIPLRFVRIEPYVTTKKSLTGDSSERVDTRVLQVIYQFDQSRIPVYVGQQMDVFIDGGYPPPAVPSETTNPTLVLPRVVHP
jgi:multidrug efflux pump subunit AcrA (membrane-fusion protein)